LIVLSAPAQGSRFYSRTDLSGVVALGLIQTLHGITFALLHLACMRLLARIVPDHLAATAQAIYGNVGVVAATALITVLSGLLYARMGAWAFGVMSFLRGGTTGCEAAVDDRQPGLTRG
jgi:PPP family 3-phenylpropionic acid transporter